MLTSSTRSPVLPSDFPFPRGIRTLLLDDNSFDRARIKRLSGGTTLPIHMDEVGSILELDNAVSEEAYDLILVDYRLPVGDGLIALDRIQHCPRNRNAAVIMITGNETLDTAVAAMRAGCHDFLSKDEIDADTLQIAMVNAIKTASQRLAPLPVNEDFQKMLKDGIFSVLEDVEVKSRALSFVEQAQAQLASVGSRSTPNNQNGDFDALLTMFNDTDEFLFH